MPRDRKPVRIAEDVWPVIGPTPQRLFSARLNGIVDRYGVFVKLHEHEADVFSEAELLVIGEVIERLSKTAAARFDESIPQALSAASDVVYSKYGLDKTVILQKVRALSTAGKLCLMELIIRRNMLFAAEAEGETYGGRS